ncbi:redoxin domain-containing protein [Salinigranum sp. GCM10025319]|uniref:redoxin domain-containing protein n=1 Tax=Salinigranum sp. GCM10025319 TaxID=3252687 RepID=UPI0036169E7C
MAGNGQSDAPSGLTSVGDGPLAVGTEAPDVRADLVDTDGSVSTVSLSELIADGPVLLCFYTMDFSPDCVKQWCAFRDFDWFAGGDHVQIVGVSRSGVRLHRRFISQFDIGFPLYADTDLDLSDAFGLTYRTLGLTKRSRRSCFLVDTDREIRYRWLADHWLDPTRDLPPVSEIHEAVVREVGPEADDFGF